MTDKSRLFHNLTEARAEGFVAAFGYEHSEKLPKGWTLIAPKGSQREIPHNVIVGYLDDSLEIVHESIRCLQKGNINDFHVWRPLIDEVKPEPVKVAAPWFYVWQFINEPSLNPLDNEYMLFADIGGDGKVDADSVRVDQWGCRNKYVVCTAFPTDPELLTWRVKGTFSATRTFDVSTRVKARSELEARMKAMKSCTPKDFTTDSHSESLNAIPVPEAKSSGGGE